MKESIDNIRSTDNEDLRLSTEILESKKASVLNWEGREIKNLSNYSDILDAIISGKIPAAIIKAIDREGCNEIIDKMPQDQIIWHKDRIPPVGRLGGTLQEFLDINKKNAISETTQFDPRLAELYKRSKLDDLKRDYFENFCSERGRQVEFVKDLYRQLITEYFQKSGREVSVASEDGKDYHFPVVRFISNVKIHDDFTAKTAPNWGVGKITTQLATNLYLSVPEDGGGIVIYNKQRGGLDDRFKLPTFGYDSGIVKDAKKVVIKPEQGDFVIFNSTNLHEVKGAEVSQKVQDNDDLKDNSKRITAASFAGVKEDGSIIFWS